MNIANIMKDNICRERAMLTHTILCFSPKIQPRKESAIDKVVEQIIATINEPDGVSLQDIQTAFHRESGYTLPSNVVEWALHRLQTNGRIRISDEPKPYIISDEALKELKCAQRRMDDLINSVTDRLFKNTEEPNSYTVPFLKILCLTFSELEEDSVRLLKGEIEGKREHLFQSILPRCLETTKEEFTKIDHDLFEKKIFSFFENNSDPDDSLLKWFVAQNYYIMKALGIDPSGQLLSEEIFKGATFYLDTNILIPTLNPKDRHHRSILAFAEACKRLDISLEVCQITVDELRNVAAHQRHLLEKTIDQIPEDTTPKIRSEFLNSYCLGKKLDETFSIDELFSPFEQPLVNLKEFFNPELVDDLWFDSARNDHATKLFANVIKDNYSRIRPRAKHSNAAMHDSILLLWLQKIRREEKETVWLVTADTSLPPSIPQDSSKPIAITFDALLQWLVPLTVDEEDSFADIFSEMIKNRLLPQERIFDLEDFLIFQDLHMSCKELPAEDVEGCLSYMKLNVPLLDPSKARDREKLAYEVTRFFADPGRKYNQEISRLEAEKECMKSETEDIRREYEKKLGDIGKRIEEQQLQHDEELKKHHIEFKDLKNKFNEFEKNVQKESFRTKALWRAGVVTFLLFGAVGALIYFIVNKYANGPNFLQKVLNAWKLVLLSFTATLFLDGIIIGKKKLRALGWPFTKIFNVE